MNLAFLLLLLAMLLVCAFALIRVRDVFAMIVLTGVYSGLLVITYTLLGALDVAFTEAVVGASIATVFFMMLVPRLQTSDLFPVVRVRRLASALPAALFGLTLGIAVHALPTFGDPDSVMQTHVVAHYAAHSMEDMKTPNIVTAILADYRGFDTLIETAVVFSAAVVCLLALGAAAKSRKDVE